MPLHGSPQTFTATAKVFSGCSAYHSFILTEKRQLFAFGRNDAGQLGLGDYIGRPVPTEVEILNDMAIADVSCGMQHTLFLVADAEVYSCGTNEFGQLGNGADRYVPVPSKIPFFSGKEVVSVACGARTSYCLTLSGALYSFGSNKGLLMHSGNGQLGDGKSIDRSIPHLVRFPDNVRIVSISAGHEHVAALTEHGALYTFGSNSSGQLGRDGEAKLPGRVHISGRQVSSVVCGGYHTVIIVSSREIFVFGYNYSGQLGTSNSISLSRPAKLVYFEQHPIRSVFAGGYHTIVLMEESGDALGFGWNAYHQLYVGTTMFEHSPVPISSLPGDARTKSICCGDCHTLLVSEDKSCWGCGSKDAFCNLVHTQTPIHLLSSVSVAFNPPPPTITVSKLAEDLMKYILSEQTVRRGRTTDMNLKIAGGDNLCQIRLNKSFVRARLGEDVIELLEGEELSGHFTINMRNFVLMYLYGEMVAFESLRLSEIISLYDFLTRYNVSGELKIICEVKIHGLLESGDAMGAVDVYREANRFENEFLSALAIGVIKEKGVSNIADLEARDDEEMKFVANLREKLMQVDDTIVDKDVGDFFADGNPSVPGTTIVADIGKEPKKETSLVDAMRSLYEAKEDSGDVDIRSNEYAKRNHRARKFVLSARKWFFRNMFYRKSQHESVFTRLSMPLGPSFEKYLHFLYTGAVPSSLSECFSLIPIFNHFPQHFDDSDSELKNYCEWKILDMDLNDDNCVETLVLAGDLGLTRIKERVLEYVGPRFQELEGRLAILSEVALKEAMRSTIDYQQTEISYLKKRLELFDKDG